MDTMTHAVSNPCIRCGKERIDGMTHERKIDMLLGSTTVIVTETVCPDEDCQKIVMAELTLKREKKEAMDNERIERMQRMRSQKKKNH